MTFRENLLIGLDGSRVETRNGTTFNVYIQYRRPTNYIFRQKLFNSNAK